MRNGKQATYTAEAKICWVQPSLHDSSHFFGLVYFLEVVNKINSEGRTEEVGLNQYKNGTLNF